MSHEWKMLGVEWERNINKDMWGSLYQLNFFNTLSKYHSNYASYDGQLRGGCVVYLELYNVAI
jgi:hypothetical protein